MIITTIFHGFTGWTLELASLDASSVTSATAVYEQANAFFWELHGSGFTYDSNGHATAGTISSIIIRGPDGFFANPFIEITGLAYSLSKFDHYVSAADNDGFLADLYSGNDRFVILDAFG